MGVDAAAPEKSDTEEDSHTIQQVRVILELYVVPQEDQIIHAVIIIRRLYTKKVSLRGSSRPKASDICLSRLIIIVLDYISCA